MTNFYEEELDEYLAVENEINFIKVDSECVGMRADLLIKAEFPDFSRSIIQKYIEGGNVFVNDKPIKSNYKVRENDVLALTNSYLISKKGDENEVLICAENIPLDILYEDEVLAVINKPKGMVVHPATSHISGTLVNALMYRYGENLSDINGAFRRGIVHRLDRDTSGVLLIAKNNEAHEKIAKQLAERTVLRKYYAVVCNNIAQDNGTINKPIGRNPSNRKKMDIVQNGREAITHYKVLERFSNKFTLVEARLETGRTHQIRVHFASIGNAVLGDEEYKSGGNSLSSLGIKNLQNGQILHAKTVGFVHPATEKYIEINSPLPDYFENVLRKLSFI